MMISFYSSRVLYAYFQQLFTTRGSSIVRQIEQLPVPGAPYRKMNS